LASLHRRGGRCRLVSRPRRWTLSRSAYVALHCTCWRRHCSTCKVGSEVCLVGEKSCQACSVVMVGGGWEAGGWAAYERCRCVSDSWGVSGCDGGKMVHAPRSSHAQRSNSWRGQKYCKTKARCHRRQNPHTYLHTQYTNREDASRVGGQQTRGRPA